jgi:glucans biosynthesis protein C
LFYMFVLGPITEYFIAHSWTSTVPTSFSNEWIKHIRNGQFLQENGPLWFCLALLIFSLAYAALRGTHPEASAEQKEEEPPRTAKLIRFALLIAASTFLVRLVQPSGATFLNMQLGDFPQYILLFIAGVAAARERWLLKLDWPLARRWLLIILPVGFAAWFAILFAGGALSGGGTVYSGGWHRQAASLDLWESFTGVAICFGLLASFRIRFNSQGRLTKFLSDNAFSAYVFHPPFVIIAARLLQSVLWLPILKFVVVTLLGAAASFSLSAVLFRRIPVLRRIL